jgi:PKD repeat protein
VLKVTDDRGYSATLSKDVTVTASQNPTAAFSFSPTSPRPNEDVVFNASASRAATGRTLVSYDWDFGTGRTGSGVTATKAYGLPGTYNVTLTVTDDVGNKGTSTSAVTVQAAPLTALFTFSPTSPARNQSVYFDASTSTAALGRTIVSFNWNFGDGATGSGRTTNHTYAQDGRYTVVLTIADDIGQTATKSDNVPVTSGAIVAGFTYSPTEPKSGDMVYFNGGDSTSPFGITRYVWNFGDGSAEYGGDGAAFSQASHAFTNTSGVDRKFVVRLTVTDAMGRTATITKEVTVKP